jgi:hypothetical protein
MRLIVPLSFRYDLDPLGGNGRCSFNASSGSAE